MSWIIFSVAGDVRINTAATPKRTLQKGKKETEKVISNRKKKRREKEKAQSFELSAAKMYY